MLKFLLNVPIYMSKGTKRKKGQQRTMGMAASQARLLTITARMHDVEYQAQSIQNAKIQLATQSDEVYQDYLEALDATTLTVKDSNGNTISANFNNLWGRNAVDTVINKYAIQDEHGNLIKEFESAVSADRYYNLTPKTVQQCANKNASRNSYKRS